MVQCGGKSLDPHRHDICLAGYRFNCESTNSFCESHDCSLSQDISTCCLPETEAGREEEGGRCEGEGGRVRERKGEEGREREGGRGREAEEGSERK